MILSKPKAPKGLESKVLHFEKSFLDPSSHDADFVMATIEEDVYPCTEGDVKVTWDANLLVGFGGKSTTLVGWRFEEGGADQQVRELDRFITAVTDYRDKLAYLSGRIEELKQYREEAADEPVQ
jgi:hypothetical protein